MRSFARAVGELAKTDRLDARLMARYGRDCRPKLSRLTDAKTAELEALLQRRRQLIEMQVAERKAAAAGRQTTPGAPAVAGEAHQRLS